MSTNYILFTKNRNTDISNREDEQFYTFHNPLIYVLPKTNLIYYCRNGLYEKYMIEWCKEFCSKDGIFLDIGAHTGTYAISLAEYCHTVYAFEPQRMTYNALCGGVALSNIENIYCIPCALGSPTQTGINKLKIRSNDGGGSSLYEINGCDVLREEEIVVRTLDSIFYDETENTMADKIIVRKDIPIKFIKMDVEYNELNVLIGAKKTLISNDFPPILFEANTDSQELNDNLFFFLENELNYNIISLSNCDFMYLATKKT